MRKIRLAISASTVLACASAHALVFNGGSYYSLGPSTQAPGTTTNNLILTDTVGGFSISGQFIINISSGSSAGTLLEWQVRRPISSLSPAGPEVMTLGLTGFIDAPVGNGTASGALTGGIFDGVTNSIVTYTAIAFGHSGSGVTNYNLTNTTNLNYNGAGLELVQTYFVDYSYSGTGGTYILDFPADLECVPVPEPGTLATVGIAALIFIRRTRRTSQT